MKTSFEKFMASNAVKPVELGEHKVELGKIDDIETSIKAFSSDIPELESKLNLIKNELRSSMDGLASLVNDIDMMDKLAKQIGDTGLQDRILRNKNLVNQKYGVVAKLFNKNK